jgi:hypothetical protein
MVECFELDMVFEFGSGLGYALKEAETVSLHLQPYTYNLPPLSCCSFDVERQVFVSES